MTLIALVHLLKKAPHTSNSEWFYDKRWSKQDAFLKDKICQYNYAFMQISSILVHREIIMAYYAYIQWFLFFGIIASGGIQKSIFSPLIITQKSILQVGF